MQATAQRVADALGQRRGDQTVVTEARVTSLQQIAVGLDANPGSAALWSQWLGLLRDLQRGQESDDVAKGELAVVMATVRGQESA